MATECNGRHTGNKRKLLQAQEIQPDMAQRTLRLKKAKSEEVHVSKPAESEHDHQQPTSSIPEPTGQPTTYGNNTTSTLPPTHEDEVRHSGSTRGLHPSCVRVVAGAVEFVQTGCAALTTLDRQEDLPFSCNPQPTRHNVRKNTRTGPCVFGCDTTTNIRKGVQVWKIPPVPCPWTGMLATLPFAINATAKE